MMDYDLHIRELETAYTHMWQNLLNEIDHAPFSVRNREVIRAGY